MNRTAVLNVVGLTQDLLGPNTPRLSAWIRQGRAAPLRAVTPAVTCTAQASMLTGEYPDNHGIVGNGWYFRDECEVKFWKQSNRLVRSAKVWETARALDPAFTCANLFWWFNMYSSADWAVTPRPMYPSDGRKLPDVWSHPATLRDELLANLGTFPLFDFWGPRTTIKSSRWIAESAKHVVEKHDPTLTLVYLPHLDYNLQRLGPHDPAIAADLKEIDDLSADLIDFFEARDTRAILLSEYGITPVNTPIHLNRELRKAGLVAVREELGLEMLDAGESAAFAVADHQIAHVYVNDAGRLAQVREIVEKTPGVERVLDGAGKKEYQLDHSRSGELVAISRADAWFTYYYWLEDRKAPDFARTVDIHRKPGYDPVELFIDPAIKLLPLKVAGKLLRKMLGFRYLMDVIPLDASLVKGSHGRVTDAPSAGPLIATRNMELLPEAPSQTDISGIVLSHLGFG